MRPVNDRIQVQTWIQDKQAREVELAWTLLEVFNNEPLIGQLRGLAAEALSELRELKKSSPIASAAVTQAWQSQMQIVGLCKRTVRARHQAKPKLAFYGFNSLNPQELDAQDCSDLIRLYGEFIEKAGALGARGTPGERGDYGLQNRLKTGFRVEDELPGHPGIKPTWNELPKVPQTPVSHTGQVALAKELAAHPLPQPPPFGRHRIRGGMPQPTSNVHAFLISQQGGIASSLLADTSTVNRMDRLFGLVPAADISGTTTDSIYFLQRFGPALDPVFQLLPLATIVSGAHHSLLEVALSLSLNRNVTGIDYSIGFYGSLMPERAALCRGEFDRWLNIAERSVYNPRMLVYYETPAVPAGCFLFEEQDYPAFREFAKATRMLRSCRSLPAWPNQQDVMNLCRRERLPMA